MNFLIASLGQVLLPTQFIAEAAIPSTQGGKSAGGPLHTLSAITDSSFLEVVSFPVRL